MHNSLYLSHTQNLRKIYTAISEKYASKTAQNSNSTHGNAVFGLLFPMCSKIRRTIFEKSAFFDLALYDYRTTFHFGILEGVE